MLLGGGEMGGGGRKRTPLLDASTFHRRGSRLLEPGGGLGGWEGVLATLRR